MSQMLHLVITMASLYCFYINKINAITYYETFFPHNNPHWIKIQHFIKSSKNWKNWRFKKRRKIGKFEKLIVINEIQLWNTYYLKCFNIWMFKSWIIIEFKKNLQIKDEKWCRLENNFWLAWSVSTIYEIQVWNTDPLWVYPEHTYWFIYYSSVLSLNRFWW